MSPTGSLTGTGGTGTYQLDNTVPQTSVARNGMTAYDYNGNNSVYWGLPTDRLKGCFGNTFRFAADNNLARFTGKIDNGSGGAGNTLTVTVPPLVGRPQIAVGMLVGGMGCTECKILSGSGTSWVVDGIAQLVPEIIGMGAYIPVVLDPANPGTGPFCLCAWSSHTFTKIC